MSPYLNFVVSFGGLLALMCVIAAWLFRTASAPLSAKILIPTLAVGLGCYAPFAVSGMMGFPVAVGIAGLPDHAELVAFVAHDEDKMVDLWLRDGGASAGSAQAVPRAYETRLTPGMKQTLRQAAETLARGGRAELKKDGPARPKNSGGDRLGIGDDDQRVYELDQSALSALPPKD